VFVFLDEDNAYAAARSGQLGLVRIAPSMAVAPQQKNLKLWVRDSVENRGIVFPMVPAGKKDANGYPIGNDITADVAIRRAINYAIDRKQLADQVMEGHAIPAYSAVQGLPWQGQSVAFKDGDSEKARTILEEAGWKVGKDGVRVKDGKEARLTLWYASGDSTRRDLAEAVRAMLEPVGIQISLQSGSWETVERHMHANPTLFGWGSLDPMELFHHYSNQAAGVEYYNPGYYSNPVVEQHLKQAIDAPDWQKALPFWQQVEWDGKQGAGVQGDAAWAWLLNIQHTYLANPCIDLGKGAPRFTVAGHCSIIWTNGPGPAVDEVCCGPFSTADSVISAGCGWHFCAAQLFSGRSDSGLYRQRSPACAAGAICAYRGSLGIGPTAMGAF
jgi:peptide/nickel transport system substrate-binding protein